MVPSVVVSFDIRMIPTLITTTDMNRYDSIQNYSSKKTACRSDMRFLRYKTLKSVGRVGPGRALAANTQIFPLNTKELALLARS